MPEQPPPNPETPPSSPPPSGPPEYRFAADASVPEWARGKRPEEVLGLVKPIVERFQQWSTQPQPQAQQPVSMDPNGYVTGDQLVAFSQQAAQQFNPQIQSAVELAANAVYGFAQQKYAKEFGKYGPEIQAKLAGVPKNLWTLDTFKTVVNVVQAEHLDDYRAEWQTEARASMEPTMRSGGAAGSAPVPEKDKENSLESEKIPDEWKLRAEKAGVTEATVREFCSTQGMSEVQFYKQFETPRNPIVAEVQVGR